MHAVIQSRSPRPSPLKIILHPVLVGVPAAITAQCGAVPAAATVTATDNCDLDVPVTFSETVNCGGWLRNDHQNLDSDRCMW